MGDYTTNSYFYKPSLGATGSTEKGLFDDALQVADTQIEANRGDINTTLTDGSSGSLTAGMLVYLSAASTVQEADATDSTKPAVAFCVSTDGTTVVYRVSGVATSVVTVGSADVAVGNRVYLSTTAGKVTATPPSTSGNIVQCVGVASTAESGASVNIILNIDQNYVEV